MKHSEKQTGAQPFPTPDAAGHSRIQALENQITELAAHIHAATFRLLELIREYDECNGWEGPGLRSCAHWLNWKCGINLGAAREKVRVAHALKNLPGISGAFRDGRLSYSKVRAMTRVACPGNEEYLLNFARSGTAAHVERLVRHYRKVKRLEALERDNARYALRQLTGYFDDDGSFVLNGRFTPEQGAVLKAALDAIMEETWQERKNVSAETSSDHTMPCSEPIAARRADALVRMAEGCLSGLSSERCGGDHYLVHVHTDMETLRASGTGSEAEIQGARNVSAETSRRLACDAGLVHWLEQNNGETLDIGRKSRTIPPAIRRALQRRDGGCRFPGCTCSRFVDAHHIRHWADGGKTCMENLVLLCRHHHRLVHEGGFGVHARPGGAIEFTAPEGPIIPACAETRFRGNVFALTTENARNGIRITSNTSIPHWHGERMDDQLAVEGLLQHPNLLDQYVWK